MPSDVVQLPSSSSRWRKMFSVQSASRPVSYVVAEDAQGHWGCSCPAWIYHTPRHDCKHILKVKDTLGRASRIDVFTEADVEARPALKKAISRFSLVEI